MDANDTELLERAREGDPRAMEALLARHQRSVYRFGLKMCRDEEDAKDILQETLLAVARNVKDFRGASSVSTWLYTIARSFCIKKRRRSKYAPEQEESLDAREPGEAARQIVDPARAPDDALAGRQIESALEQAIGSLDPMYREVLVLRDVEGLTAPEVAEVMGLTVEAVKSRLHRARVAVREAVAPLLGVPGAAPRAVPAPAPPLAAAAASAVTPATLRQAQDEREERCPDIVELFSKHLEGEISSTLCADMERHLARCPACDARCQSLQKVLAVCKAAPLPEVPAPVQASIRQALRDLVAVRS